MSAGELIRMFNKYIPRILQQMWDLWGIDTLVMLGLILQVILTFCGNRRRYDPRGKIRVMIWTAYVLSSKVAGIALSKLTVIPPDIQEPNSRGHLLALLAPLIFIQIGKPDAITAFSLQDDQVGLRQVPGLIIQTCLVIFIIKESWRNSSISYLYLPLFLAGIIKYGEYAWALWSALKGMSGLTISEINEEKKLSSMYKKIWREDLPDIKSVLRAYYRFFVLKPHLENWIYYPQRRSAPQLSIDDCSEEEIFKITDIELGFMYDALYTKAPIIYTKTGLALRIVSFFSLISTLCGFAVLNEESFVYDIDSGIVYYLLVATLILEVYQIIRLFFSDWAIVNIIGHRRNPIVKRFLQLMARKSRSCLRWSNSLRQFNLLTFCLHDKHAKISRIRILKALDLDMKLRKHRSITRVDVPAMLKKLMLEEMKASEEIRLQKPFSERGKWALERFQGLNEINPLERATMFNSVLKREFDKSIIIWHLVTDICCYIDGLSGTNDSKINAILKLSNYMMYLLAWRPYELNSITADIVFDHVSLRLKTLLRLRLLGVKDEKEICDKLINLSDRDCREFEKIEKQDETVVTKGWCFLKDIQKLSKSLMSLEKENRWKLIGNVWAEMLCYAASGCEVEYNAENLRKGGEFITHIWILLAHKTNKYSSDNHADSCI